MLRFILECLAQRECQITIAYYEPYSVSPNQSVPFFKLPFAKPSINSGEFLGHKTVGVGCWLPEVEFTHYWATKHWKSLVDEHDVHLTVSGSSMAALPYVQTNTPFLAWIATDWEGDREHRVQQFHWLRRLVDMAIAAPVIKRLERRIIKSGSVVALSDHTQQQLNKLVDGSPVSHVLAMPIDTEHFAPSTNTQATPQFVEKPVDQTVEQPVEQHEPQDAFKIGFVGRFEDPRKHLSLLLNAVALIKERGVNIELVLVGDELSPASRELIKQLQIQDSITVVSYVERQQLPSLLQQWQAFVLPSFQEGLCIAALEAMSCGLPVISTRCGGPESYIVDGENGILCDHQADQIADAVLQLFSDLERRVSYANAARKLIAEEFSKQAKTKQFLSLFDDLSR